MENTLAGEQAVSRLADRYFDDLGLGWLRRERMLCAREGNLSALASIDARMQAQIEAFIHLGEPCARRTLKQLYHPVTPRELFAATIQSVVAREADLFEACMAIGEALPSMRPACLHAAQWCALVAPQDTAAAWRRLKPDAPIANTRLMFALFSLRAPALGADATQWAAPLLNAASIHPELLPLALGLARLYDWPHWAQHAQRALSHSEPTVRTAAVEHLLVTGSSVQQHEAFQVGAAIAIEPGACGDAVVGPLMLASTDRVVPILRALRDTPALRARYINALAWHGDAQAVELLRPMLRDPTQGRLAAAAITVLTGSDPRHDHWQAPTPEPSRREDAHLPTTDPQRSWPWPDADAFDDWWTERRTHFFTQPQWFLGQLPSATNLVQQLRNAPLCWRPLAAWRLQRISTEYSLATDLPAHLQHARLCQIAESINERT